MNFIFCNTCCIQPKFYDTEYAKYTFQIKNEIEIYLRKIENSNDSIIEQNLKFIGFLKKMLEALSNNKKLRQNLMHLRNDLIIFKEMSAMADDRVKIIDLSIQVVMLCHSATFYCNSASRFEKKLDKIKIEFDYFKNLIKNTRNAFNQNDKFYLSILYKIPKLMRIKRGFNKKLPVLNGDVSIDAESKS